jgi:putative addiction module component (TIGR02574 family)
MTLAEIPQINELSTEEKLKLVGDLWDSIAAQLDELPVGAEERAILDSRLQAHLESPQSVLTLEAFKERLSERL